MLWFFSSRSTEPVSYTHLVSIGSFRISQDYLKKMRKDMPCSAVVNFPYDNVNGYYQYPENIRSDMEEFMIQAVSEYVDKDRIFMWK